MKKLGLLTCVALVALPVFASAQGTLERIATEILGDRFGINTRDVLGIRRDRGDVYDLGPTLSMSRYGNKSASEVQRLRASGMGWGQIAHQIGMHPGQFNKLRKQGYFDREPFWDDIVKRRYGVRQDQIDVVRKRGANIEGILGSVIIGRMTGKSPAEVWERQQDTRDWRRTESFYKVDLDDWEKHGKRVGWEGASVPPGTPPKAVGPGKSKGKGPGTSQGKGKGNSSAGGQGKGKSKGKGKGGDDF